MDSLTAMGHGALAVDLNAPGSYLNWSIFTISVANLVLIAVMVVIFGAALLLPFPGRHRHAEPAGTGDVTAPAATTDGAQETAAPPASWAGDDADSRMWTARVRRRALAALPPDKLLPDRQPGTSPRGSTCSAWHRSRRSASRS